MIFFLLSKKELSNLYQGKRMQSEFMENIYKAEISAVNKKGFKKVSPFFVPGSIVNMISGLVSMKHGFMGPNTSVVTACSTGNHCIGTASRSIACGEADIMIAGGAEMASTPLSIAGFISSCVGPSYCVSRVVLM